MVVISQGNSTEYPFSASADSEDTSVEIRGIGSVRFYIIIDGEMALQEEWWDLAKEPNKTVKGKY